MEFDIRISRKFPTFYSKSIGLPNCTSSDPEAFFPERGSDVGHTVAAKKVCSTCPYIGACREWAIDNNEIGVWGGTTELDRKRIKRMRRNNIAS